MTLADMARATGLTRATARRLLLTLVALGYVCTDGRTSSSRPACSTSASPTSRRCSCPTSPSRSWRSSRSGCTRACRRRCSTARDRLRGPGQHATDHGHLAGDRLPAAGGVDVDGTGAARRPRRSRSSTSSSTTSSSAGPTPQSITDVEALRCRDPSGAQPGLRADRPRARGGDPIRRRAAARSPRSNLAAVNVGTHAARVTLKELRGVILPELLATAAASRPSWPSDDRVTPHPLIGRVEVLVDQLRRRGHRRHDRRGDRRGHRADPPSPRRARVGQGRPAGDAGEELRSDRRVRSRLSSGLRRTRTGTDGSRPTRRLEEAPACRHAEPAVERVAATRCNRATTPRSRSSLSRRSTRSPASTTTPSTASATTCTR